MAGVSIKIESDVVERLLELQKKIGNLEPFYKNAGEVLLENTKQRFRSETDPEGNKWTPLAISTQKQRGKKNTKILQRLGDRGGLLGTLSYYADPSALLLGSNKVYARIHQEGGDAGRGLSVKIPARPYLGLSKEDLKSINDLITDFLSE